MCSLGDAVTRLCSVTSEPTSSTGTDLGSTSCSGCSAFLLPPGGEGWNHGRSPCRRGRGPPLPVRRARCRTFVTPEARAVGPGPPQNQWVSRASGRVAAVGLRLIDPWAAVDRHAEEDDTELHGLTGLVAADVHARGKLDECVAGSIRLRPAVVVVDGEGPGLDRDQGLAGVGVPAGRRVRAE